MDRGISRCKRDWSKYISIAYTLHYLLGCTSVRVSLHLQHSCTTTATPLSLLLLLLFLLLLLLLLLLLSTPLSLSLSQLMVFQWPVQMVPMIEMELQAMLPTLRRSYHQQPTLVWVPDEWNVWVGWEGGTRKKGNGSDWVDRRECFVSLSNSLQTTM